MGKKPAISYIIESYPKNTEFVVTLGYKGEQVKDFLTLAYPEKKFTYVWVDKYEGPGTSLGYSMLQAEKKLQAPFVYHACDTIVEGFKVPLLTSNWVAGIRIKGDATHYASFDVNKKGEVVRFNPKGTKKYGLIHIGLVGIRDYKSFWKGLRNAYTQHPDDTSLNDISGIKEMLVSGVRFKAVKVRQWLDIGNPPALALARAKISDRFDNLDKVDEALFFFKGFAIKFFADPNKVANRVKRSKILGSLAPKTLAVKKNFYKYKFAKGSRYSDVVTAADVSRFLDWSKKNLWKPKKDVGGKKFQKICRDFYEKKTFERIEKFLASRSIKDEEVVINGERVAAVRDLLKKTDFKWLSSGLQTAFHGDYILENIIKTQEGYTLLDWRQDFGGLLKGGDMYYDLAKFYHNLVVNHDVIHRNKFVVGVRGKRATLAITRKPHLVATEKAFEKWVIDEGLDLDKVRILRAIIWLNMSPLHHAPFDHFLYYFGRYELYKVIEKTTK